MKLVETEETEQFSFEPFASHPFYTDINRSLVCHALSSFAQRPCDSTLTIVDVACGTGVATRLIAEDMARQGKQTRIIGVDPSAEALRRARRSMEGMEVMVEFIQGEAADLPAIVQGADAAFLCNAIHLLPDKLCIFQLIGTILVPGGIFACNSAFYDGAYPKESERFYRLWIRRAVGWLRKEHPEVRFTREAKAKTMQWLNPEEYSALLGESGFCCIDTAQECAMMSMDSHRDIGRYRLFIEGALPGIPLALGAAALGISVYQAGQELGLTELPRNWLQIVAIKA